MTGARQMGWGWVGGGALTMDLHTGVWTKEVDLADCFLCKSLKICGSRERGVELDRERERERVRKGGRCRERKCERERERGEEKRERA